jgi:hypothetical protein
MKIAMVITGLGMGGAERQVCDLADQFIRLGHHILIISMTGEIINRPHSTAADIVSLQMRKTPFSVFKAYWQAIRLLNLSYDVERMVEMCAQAYKACYRVSFVGC